MTRSSSEVPKQAATSEPKADEMQSVADRLIAGLEGLLNKHPNISTALVSRRLGNYLISHSLISKEGSIYQLQLSSGKFSGKSIDILFDDAIGESRDGYSFHFSAYRAEEIITFDMSAVNEPILVKEGGYTGVITVYNHIKGPISVNNTINVLYERIDVVERLLRDSMSAFANQKHTLQTDEETEVTIESIFSEKLASLSENTQ